MECGVWRHMRIGQNNWIACEREGCMTYLCETRFFRGKQGGVGWVALLHSTGMSRKIKWVLRLEQFFKLRARTSICGYRGRGCIRRGCVSDYCGHAKPGLKTAEDPKSEHK